jgi:hypothetical protein
MIQDEENHPRQTCKPFEIELLLGLVFLLTFQSRVSFAVPPAPSADHCVRSHSGQFLIQAATPSGRSVIPASLGKDPRIMLLEPTLLTVSCERIKERLMHQVGSSSAWRGKIYVVLYPSQGGDEPIGITSELFKDGWQYRVDLPEVIERERYVRTMVQVLLLELANRSSTGRSAEIPLWLSEGFTQQLLSAGDIQIILQPPTANVNGLTLSSTNYTARRNDPIEHARKVLREVTPLTFQQLSWPIGDPLEGNHAEAYRNSAQLFVADLLALKQGASCLRAMLAQLPECYNWQLAFLRAFSAYFERPLDVEKWWALHFVQFTTHETAQTWPLPESWQRLEAALSSAVQVHMRANDLPMHTQVTLQTVLRDSDRARQTAALKNTLLELELLRPRVARELAGLVNDYCETIRICLHNRDKFAPVLFVRKTLGARDAIEEALSQLDALDARRAALRAEQMPVAGAKR